MFSPIEIEVSDASRPIKVKEVKKNLRKLELNTYNVR